MSVVSVAGFQEAETVPDVLVPGHSQSQEEDAVLLLL